MKKIFVLLSIALLISCAGEDSPASEPTILRKWYYNETVVDGTHIPYPDNEACGKDYLQFYDINKLKNVDIWDCEEDVDWQGTFTLTGNILVLNNGVSSRTVTVTTLSFDYLIFEYDSDVDGDGDLEHCAERYTAL